MSSPKWLLLRTGGQSDDAELATLLGDSLVLMAAHAQRQGFSHWAFKFRSYVLSLGDLLYRAVPEAKILFLYRNARTWARSFSRAFGAPDSGLGDRLDRDGFRYIIPSIDTHLRTYGNTIKSGRGGWAGEGDWFHTVEGLASLWGLWYDGWIRGAS